MSLSMYAASAPRFDAMLAHLAHILDKAAAHAEAKRIDPAALLEARLFPDMFPLRRQVQIACDNAKGPVARLAGIELPRHEDTEQSFEDLQARIAKVRAFIATATPQQFEGNERRAIEFSVGGHQLKFNGQDYLLNFAIPNFHFHLVTAYNILRHCGVEIGKRDFLEGA